MSATNREGGGRVTGRVGSDNWLLKSGPVGSRSWLVGELDPGTTTNKVDNNSALSASHSGLSVCFWTPNIVLVVLYFIDCVFEIKFYLIWFEFDNIIIILLLSRQPRPRWRAYRRDQTLEADATALEAEQRPRPHNFALERTRGRGQASRPNIPAKHKQLQLIC